MNGIAVVLMVVVSAAPVANPVIHLERSHQTMWVGEKDHTQPKPVLGEVIRHRMKEDRFYSSNL